jgi:hypothetical protein
LHETAEHGGNVIWRAGQPLANLPGQPGEAGQIAQVFVQLEQGRVEFGFGRAGEDGRFQRLDSHVDLAELDELFRFDSALFSGDAVFSACLEVTSSVVPPAG